MIRIEPVSPKRKEDEGNLEVEVEAEIEGF